MGVTLGRKGTKLDSLDFCGAEILHHRSKIFSAFGEVT